jgi:hypothetical protein
MPCMPRRLGIAIVFALILVFVQVPLAQTSRHDSARVSSSINLNRALAPNSPCRTFQRPIQFFSESALLVTSDQPGDCYRSVGQVALNLISTDGHVLARKIWPSTDPGIVIDPRRLVLVLPTALEIDDQKLASIQSLELPQHRGMPILSMDQQGAVTVTMDGNSYIYSGTPLTLLKEDERLHTAGEPQSVFTFTDGQAIVRDGESLNLQKDAHLIKKIASLNWVIPPCKGYVNCQMWDAGVAFRVSTGERKRILVFSNGSRFPVTDAAGLFPYFRLQVFDIDTGTELYREEDVLRTGQRSAAISPDGYRLATSDGQKIVVRDLR